MEEKTDGLLIQAIPYLGAQKILKIFTKEAGLISLMAKKTSLTPLTTPFLIAEWVYKTGKEDLHLLIDATLLNDLSSLKQNYSTISAAGQIASALLSSQHPEKKESALYALTTAYLTKLPSFKQPETLVASFLLKLLSCEGLLAAPSEYAPFATEEQAILHSLTTARRFEVLQSLSVSQELLEKIFQLFKLTTEYN